MKYAVYYEESKRRLLIEAKNIKSAKRVATSKATHQDGTINLFNGGEHVARKPFLRKYKRNSWDMWEDI